MLLKVPVLYQEAMMTSSLLMMDWKVMLVMGTSTDEVLFKVMTLKPLLRVRLVGKIMLKVGV